MGSSDKSEKFIEMSLVRAVKEAGGMAPKFTAPGTSGMPDRIVLLPEGQMFFVELKAPGKKPRPLQERMHERLRALGFDVYVIDDAKKIQEVLHGYGLKR
ncbi:MAG: VRR-NUC domain-containing protein [Candidatus Weimeria sp.]